MSPRPIPNEYASPSTARVATMVPAITSNRPIPSWERTEYALRVFKVCPSWRRLPCIEARESCAQRVDSGCEGAAGRSSVRVGHLQGRIGRPAGSDMLSGGHREAVLVG